ncbi:CHAT domain-containing protein [Planobispora takensis]|uniref:CHAT domain-containing protein n=1 Tax=Planobispora takensis TaxID=1367882 RepID=A0A8J3SZM5_9ACTN|nr:CHAT domain-containing protein [Planobispora takensis]GII03599.1 hypothetical protein Pta02_56070 [Planobispora takensis]
MDPVAVLRAARTVRAELDGLLGDSAGELRDRLDPILAEEGRRDPEGLSHAAVMVIAQYGPAWERLAVLLHLDEPATAAPAPGPPAAHGSAPDPAGRPALPDSGPSAPPGHGSPAPGGGRFGSSESGPAGIPSFAAWRPSEPPDPPHPRGERPSPPLEPWEAPEPWEEAPESKVPEQRYAQEPWHTQEPWQEPEQWRVPEPWQAPEQWQVPGTAGQPQFPEAPGQQFPGTPGHQAPDTPGHQRQLPDTPGHRYPDAPGQRQSPGMPEPWQAAGAAERYAPPPDSPAPPAPSPAPTPSPSPGPAPAPPPGQAPPQPQARSRSQSSGKGPLQRLTGALRRRHKKQAGSAEWEAFPLIEAPEEVVAGWGLEVRVGITGASGREAESVSIGEPFDLDVQVIAEGFEAPDGWRARLRVEEDSPYPAAVLRLRALPLDRRHSQEPAAQEAGEDAQTAARRIQVVYSVGGQAVGFGTRAVTVLASPGLIGRESAPAEVAGTRVQPPARGRSGGRHSGRHGDPHGQEGEPGGFSADVTAVIVHGDHPGRLWWSYLSPHFVTPDQAEACELGTRASAFGRELVAEVTARTGHADMSLYLRSAGRRLALKVPPGFWELLEAVAARIAPRPPTVLLLSQEPYVPWELATLERPIDPSAPAFLDCQAAVGRWALGGRLPELPPPPTAGSDVARLREALAASGEQPRVLGLTVPGGTGVLIRADRPALAPRLVAGLRLGGSPFVFLAGDGGPDVAQAFLVAGAGGVAAPLWPVPEEAVQDMAMEFYRRCLAGEPPAEVLRSLRCAGSAAATAYRFSGHPSAVLPPQPQA